MALKPEQRKALIEMIDAVMGLIVHGTRGPLGGVPSGELYAALMPLGITIDQYQEIIEALKISGNITESGFLLKASQKWMN